MSRCQYFRLRNPDYSRDDFDVDPVDPVDEVIAEMGRCFLLERDLRRVYDQNTVG